MTVTDRITARERPDTSDLDLTDNGFFFEWRGHCDAGDCEFREVAYTETHAAWMVRTHPCPMKYDTRRYNSLSIAEHYWTELDGVVDEIMAISTPGGPEHTDEQLWKLKGRASGLAFALVKACQPYYADEQAVSRMSLKRYRQRQGIEDWEPTPGFKYDPPVPGLAPAKQYKQIDPGAPTFGRTAVERAIQQLGDKKVGQIKSALNGGMFKATDLTKVYGVPSDVLEAIAKS